MPKRGRTALFVMDMQTDFLDPKGRWPVALVEVPGLIESANRGIKAAQEQGLEVVYIANEFPPERWRRNGFLNGAAIKGQPGVELDRRLKVINANYFPKSQGNAFHNRALDDFLKAGGIKHVILAGVFASECIKSTALGALKLGYQVSVLINSVADADANTKQKALQAMVKKGVVLISSLAQASEQQRAALPK